MDDSSCSICATIADYVGHWQAGLLSEFFDLKLGPFSGFQERTKCKPCQAVFKQFNTEEHPPKPRCQLIFARIEHKQRFWIYPPCGDPHGYLELVPSVGVSPKGEHFLPINPNWLDIQRVRRWPLHCDSEHSYGCFDLPSWKTLEDPPSMILVDVKSWRLVQGIQPQRYVALSYVWGRIGNDLETTKSNFQELQKPGALDSQPWSHRLPRTVYDALLFTRQMGEQYLWVDRLCIIQDDDKHKDKQLKSMASIYSRSYFTIVAVDAPDANHGLAGLPGTSLPRTYNMTKLDFSPVCSMIKAPVFESQFNIKEWHRRCWTFQERILSNRNIVFFEGRVFWECQQSVWTEELGDAPDGLVASRSSRRNLNDRYSFDFLKYPDLHLYSKLVSIYNGRLLTHQTDGLNAFSAILHALGRSFRGGFLHGMPELFFDFAMLWKPLYPQKRRNGPFPSWSWVSWEGNVALSLLKKSHRLIYDGQDFGAAIEITPEVTWYKTSERTGKRICIDNSYISFQLMREDSSIYLPSGWSRAKPAGSPLSSTTVPEDFCIFRHGNIPNVEFLHPVPVATEPFFQDSEPWSNHLRFKAERSVLYLGPVFKGYPQKDGWSNVWNGFVSSCLLFSVFDKQGQWCGVIHSNVADEGEMTPGQECDLIIISSGRAHRDRNDAVKVWLEEWKFVEEVRELDVYEFYNILWVENKGDVTYRKALGRIWKTAWNRQRVESVDIVLG
ncbi:heterokaryon incompatibility protein-domain-containing protein [Cenococcum geophilum]